MVKRILCFGDSNTWGYISGSDHQRYDENERWTGVLQNLLGNEYKIIEEGLNSRTIITNDPRPLREGRSGYDYLLPCLDSHDPIDLVVAMIGSNELKYGKKVKEIGELFEEYIVKIVLNRPKVINGETYKLLVAAPPIVDEGDPGDFEMVHLDSLNFNETYKEIAEKYNLPFVGNEGLTLGPDKIHLTKEAHSMLAKRIYDEIIKMEL